MIRKDILERKDDILRWISENRSKHYMCEKLSCKQETLNSYLKKMGIDYKGNQSHKGQQLKTLRISIEKYFNNEKYISSHVLRQKLLKEGIKEHKCEQCGLKEWQNVAIPLELHHIDGDHYNNNLDNLKMLCPNCHALTDNYSGRHIKETQHLQRCNHKNYCIDCGKEIQNRSIRCKSCSQKAQRKYERPSRAELKEKIRLYPITKVGIIYEVSDNTIRKWCKYYSLPYKSKEIKNISNEKWESI